MVIPENIIITVAIVLVISVLTNACLIGILAARLSHEELAARDDFDIAKRRVEKRLKERRFATQEKER